MSLYNLLHGCNPNAGPILRALELDPTQIDRFRDASFRKIDDAFVFDLYCRTGGGNRTDYPNVVLTSHSLYLRDGDDADDPTYAHYYFRIPEVVIAGLTEQGMSIDDVVDQMTPGEKMQAAIEALKNADPKGAKQAVEAMKTSLQCTCGEDDGGEPSLPHKTWCPKVGE